MVPMRRKKHLQVRSKPSIMFLKMKIILSAWSLMKREYTRFAGGELN